MLHCSFASTKKESQKHSTDIFTKHERLGPFFVFLGSKHRSLTFSQVSRSIWNKTQNSNNIVTGVKMLKNLLL